MTRVLVPPMLCVLNLYIISGPYILGPIPNDSEKSFEKIFMAIFYLLTEIFPKKNKKKKKLLNNMFSFFVLFEMSVL